MPKFYCLRSAYELIFIRYTLGQILKKTGYYIHTYIGSLIYQLSCNNLGLDKKNNNDLFFPVIVVMETMGLFQTCQKLVQIQPCNSHSLYLLGLSQFAQYENNPPGEKAQQILQDCKSSYESSIDLEGKPASGEPAEKLIGMIA